MKSVAVQAANENETDRPQYVNGVNGDTAGSNEQQQLLTAIYKPESKEAWKDALRLANQRIEQVGGINSCPVQD